MEEFAEQCDQFEELHGGEFAAWELPAMKLHFESTYRRLVGVYPEERHERRAELEQSLGAQRVILNRGIQVDGAADSLTADEIFA